MRKQLLMLGCLFFISMGYSQTNNFWKSVSAVKSANVITTKSNLPSKTIFNLDLDGIKSALKSSPLRQKASGNSNIVIQFPNAEGKMETFRIFEAPVMHPRLAAKYPEIKSYAGQGIEDPTSVIRFSIAPSGLQSMRLSGTQESVFIEPYTTSGSYTVYKKKEKSADENKLKCLVEDNASNKSGATKRNADDSTLRTYRLAVSTNGEYTQFHGGTKAGAMAAINATMTRVNGVFENDFAVTMVLIANNDAVVYTNASTDPYSTNYNSELQSTLTSVIGEANYDIGHLFVKAGDNGNAGCIGCVCVDNQKGSGFTSRGVPQGDAFDIDYVAHEIGHQFGANHTFTFRNESTNAHYEPGSGSTIMGYAGITGATDVQNNSDPYFHFYSIQQVTNYVKSTSCQTNTNTGNSVPTASAGLDYTIPKGTAFVLTGQASDADGDALTYCWEQADENDAATTYPSVTGTTGVAFRSFNPTTSNQRHFPRLETIKTGATSWKWEAVPDVARTLNFRLTVRDNKAGGAANKSDDMIVSVAAAAGPFVVNVPNTNVSWSAGSTQTVTWNVAGTTANGINAANVDILLSTDGGNTYPTALATAVANNGSYSITVPNIQGTQNRIMVKGSGNIFFDISNANFTITGGTSDTQAPSIPASLTATNATQTTIDLSWNASTDNVGVTGYDVYNGNTIVTTVTGTSYQATGLTANTSYSFRVKAKDAAGNISDFSNTATASTLPPSGDTQAPTIPANLSAANATQTTIDLSWTASTDNVGVTGYDVYSGASIIGSTASTSYQATGLTANTSYSFSVKAKDAAGNVSDFSNTATASTLPSTTPDGCTGGISSFPYAQGFENTLGSWTQGAGDDFNWSLLSGATPSRNTGPSSASQGTHYVYMEASNPNNPSKRAILNSPCFNLTSATQASVTFKYHMYGAANMGNLVLEASKDNGSTWTSVWSKSGNQGNSWQSASVDLAAYTGFGLQLRFNGVTGATYRSDIAIDDLSVTDGTVTPPTCTDVNLTITFDNYPEETSWQIVNSSNQVVASGGTYDTQPDGSTINITECLDLGSYTFTINDTYGDGICCSYGNGSYTLTSGGTTLASGGSFATSESTTFNIGPAVRGTVVENFVTTKAFETMIYPIPTSMDNHLNVVTSKKDVTYTILDMRGREITQGKVSNKSINLNSLRSGSYILKLNVEGKISSHQIVKE